MERAARIGVLLADDHTPFRQGFRSMLECDPGITVVAEAESGRQAVELARVYRPDVALVDVRMKDINGIEAIPLIRESSPVTAIIMLTMYGDKYYVSRSFENGARGFLLKDTSHDAVVKAIRLVHEGGYYCAPELAPYAEAAIVAARRV